MMDRAANGKFFHEEKCPVCGKIFIRRCRRNEWGYWYNGAMFQNTNHLTLLCSGECSKIYAEQRLRKDAIRIAGTKAYKALMLVRGGMSITKAARTVGLSNEHIGAILDRLVDLHWKEIEWLDQHPDEVPA